MAEPIKWITINGRHVPIFEHGKKLGSSFNKISDGVWESSGYQIRRTESDRTGVVAYELYDENDKYIAATRTNTIPNEEEAFNKLAKFADEQLIHPEKRQAGEDNKTEDTFGKLVEKEFGDAFGKRTPVSIEERTNKLAELLSETAINPHFNDPQSKGNNYKNNCAVCTMTTMMQLMGYNVEAGIQPDKGANIECSNILFPNLANPNNFIMPGSDTYFHLDSRNIRSRIRASLEYGGMTDIDERNQISAEVAAKAQKMPRGADKASKMIESCVKSWGNGAYGEMSVTWKNGNSHSLFLFNDNGEVKVFDMQANWVRSGYSGLNRILSEARANNTEVIRYDDFVAFKMNAKDRLSQVMKERK